MQSQHVFAVAHAVQGMTVDKIKIESVTALQAHLYFQNGDL